MDNTDKEFLENIEEYLSCKEQVTDLLNKEQVELLDKEIIQLLSTNRKKTSFVISQAAKNLENNHLDLFTRLGEKDLHFLTQRVNYLADNKIIQSYGDTRAVRFSELSL